MQRHVSFDASSVGFFDQVTVSASIGNERRSNAIVDEPAV